MANIIAIHCPECGAQTNMDFDKKDASAHTVERSCTLTMDPKRLIII